jgi:quercetin dioxygenase-like cupin family protein
MKQADLRTFQDQTPALPRSTTLFHEAGLRTLILHLNPGESIPEHHTRGAILVHCVGGQGTFSAGEETMELRPGIVISVPPSAPHAVAAAEHELLILVTVSEQTAVPR